ncbi:MAG: Gfo/Idh/MocA family oxidoreductase [Candidatus Brockarchaeota archaeon]|nr:Gfo/Idh/MocA family oxidoreductase [Candidatus Brockarchaeota archaeon]
MSDKRRVKCGVLGCGVIANEVYLPTLREKADLVATCDIVPERAKRSMELWGAKEWYASLDEMLRKSDIEAVFVLTGMGMHAAHAAKAARAGKHVLIQKPLATNMRDADVVYRAVKKAGVKALVEPNVQQDPLYKKAKSILEENAIGEVFWFRAGLGRGPPTWSEKTFFTKTAGGPLFDLGVYDIAALTFLLGPASKVSGFAKISIPERYIVPDEFFTEHLARKPYEPFWSRLGAAKPSQKIRMGAEDNTLTLLNMKNGSIGCVVANFVTPDGLRRDVGNMPHIEIYGREGALFIGGQAPLSVMTNKGDSRYHKPSGWYHVPREEIPAWNYYVASTEHFLDCIVNDREPIPNIEWGKHVSEIMIKSIQSARTGRSLKLSSTFH